jgi:hypothetical protein
MTFEHDSSFHCTNMQTIASIGGRAWRRQAEPRCAVPSAVRRGFDLQYAGLLAVQRPGARRLDTPHADGPVDNHHRAVPL